MHENIKGPMNQPQTPSGQPVQEHIRLLRTASRSKLAVLSIAVVATWGLWAALQGGEQKWSAIANKYDAQISALKKKYQVPSDIQFGAYDDIGDILVKIYKDKRNPFGPRVPDKSVEFLTDLIKLQQQYEEDRKSAVSKPKSSRIADKYGRQLSQLKTKYRIPAEIQFGIDDKPVDILITINAAKRNPFAPTTPSKDIQFNIDFSELQRRYEEDRESAFLVNLHIPYLQDPVEINGLDLADWWPFGLIAIVAAVITLSMRQRVNAIAVAWLSSKTTEVPDRERHHNPI